MSINPSIPLMVQSGPDLPGIYQAAQNFQQGEKRNRLLDLALQDAEQPKQPGFAEVTEQELGIVDSVVERIRPALGNATPDQIMGIVQQGAQALQQETGRQSPIFAEMLKDLQSGGVEAFAQGLQEYDEIRNPQKQGKSTADITNFEYVKNLPEEDRSLFTGLQRANKIVMVGEVPHVETAPGQYVPVNTPEGAASLTTEIQAARAKAKGTEAGKQQAQIEAIAPKAEAERQAGAPEAIRGAEAQISAIDSTMDEVADAIGLAKPSNTGFGSLMKFIPATDARTLRAKIDTIKANLAFDKLQNMRNLSKTGGALGQVSERELNLLESAVASLDQGLDDETLKGNLQKIIRHYSNAKYALQKIVDVNAGRLTQDQAMQDMQQLEINQPESDSKVINFEDLPDG